MSAAPKFVLGGRAVVSKGAGATKGCHLVVIKTERSVVPDANIADVVLMPSDNEAGARELAALLTRSQLAENPADAATAESRIQALTLLATASYQGLDRKSIVKIVAVADLGGLCTAPAPARLAIGTDLVNIPFLADDSDPDFIVGSLFGNTGCMGRPASFHWVFADGSYWWLSASMHVPVLVNRFYHSHFRVPDSLTRGIRFSLPLRRPGWAPGEGGLPRRRRREMQLQIRSACAEMCNRFPQL